MFEKTIKKTIGNKRKFMVALKEKKRTYYSAPDEDYVEIRAKDLLSGREMKFEFDEEPDELDLVNILSVHCRNKDFNEAKKKVYDNKHKVIDDNE